MSNPLNQVLYCPTLRTGANEINALLEIEEERRKKISPIILIRSKIDFAEKLLCDWKESSVFVGLSNYGQDSQDDLIKRLNNPINGTNETKDLFNYLKKYENIIPVVNFFENQKLRNLILLTRHLLVNFNNIALKVDLGLSSIEENLLVSELLISSLTDEEIKRTVLIIDLFNSQTPELVLQSFINGLSQKCGTSVIGNFEHVITISSSWPKERPERGHKVIFNCVDPMLYAWIHLYIKDYVGARYYYGDYASTNPSDLMDNFDYTKMSLPIPFAGYLLNDQCSWILAREGAGGENEKFRSIAKIFSQHPGFHGKDFCWGTKTICLIADGSREKAGSMGFWNKIRVNQHICGMLDKIEHDVIEGYSDYFKNQEDEESYDNT